MLELRQQTFVLVVLCLVIVAYLHFKGTQTTFTESFTDANAQWVTDNAMLVPREVLAQNIHQFDATRWPELLALAPGLPVDLMERAMKGRTTGQSVILLTDPQDARESYGGRPQILMPKGHFLALTSLTTGFGMDCGYQWVGKTIGYTDRPSLLCILSILHSHRISLKAVRIVNVPGRLWNKFEKILGSTLHVIVTYAIPKSPHMLLLIRQNINIMGFQRIQQQRLQLTMPDVTVEQVSLAGLVEGAIARVLARERTSKLPTLQLVAVVLHGEAPSNLSNTEKFTTSQINYEQDEPMYRCFGDDKIFTRTACESPYDVSGMRKPFRTVWDRKCTKDSDCPYHTGTRGGCDAKTGACEMPVGARRLSYRQFDTKPPFQPFCYNSLAWDLTGCANTQSPQWAFEGDKGKIDLRQTADELMKEHSK